LRIAIALGALVALEMGCSELPEPGRYHLIVISIDALRADRLGAYGYDRDTSPHLDAFAARGALFENVVAESSWTLPSHVTMLSGLYPSSHGAVMTTLKPGSDVRLLAELLSQAGYRTSGLTDGGYVGSAYGFARGFDRFDDADTPFRITLARARAEMERLAKDDRLFIFLHTYDVHCPYTPSQPYASRFRSPDATFIETEGRCGYPHYNRLALTPGQVRHLSDQYDASIREADDALGPFLDWLETSAHLEDTIVVITSDHGEEFWEHGQIGGHALSLHREVLMVPLVIAGPGIGSGRVSTPTGLVDLVPTLLDLVGLPVPAAVEGVSRASELWGVGSPGAEPDRSEASPGKRVSEIDWQLSLRSVMTGDWHLIVDRRTGRSRLFAVPDDPREATDLAKEHEEVVDALLDHLSRFDAARERRDPVPLLEQLTPEERERLRRLGYAQ
jgi:arylsulfatase A-like enzyme